MSEFTPATEADNQKSREAARMNESERAAITAINKRDKEQLVFWQHQLEQAQTAVEYWLRQVDHSGALYIRGVLCAPDEPKKDGKK